MMLPIIDNAVASWRSVLGDDHVLTASDVLTAASKATLPTRSKIFAILRPSNQSEVQACLRIANQFVVPVYPSSRGCNWGLGSRVPPNDSVLMDLSRMDNIVDYDERMGYLVVEPGVTFQQAYEFLRDKSSTFFLPVIGGSPYGSIVGNIAEHGEGAGPYGQRVEFVTNFHVVLPNGDCIHSGFGRYEAASSKHLHRHGVGPCLEGLLTQSNLGVITKLTIWLTPHPKILKPFLATIANRELLSGAIDASRELLLHRIIEANGIGIWNSYKINATLGGYPWEAMQGLTPLDPVLFPSEPWVIGGAIYAASAEIAQATGSLVEERLDPYVENWQWCDASDSNNAYQGVPTQQNVRSAYWRKKSGLPEKIDPDADQCGLIWICIAVPLIGSAVDVAIRTIEPIIRNYGFEPNIGFNCSSGRCAHFYISLIYDREVEGDDEQAVACHNAVVESMKQQGHLPYRLGLLSMDSLPDSDDDYRNCLKSIKDALDPNSVLAPGRYDMR